MLGEVLPPGTIGPESGEFGSQHETFFIIHGGSKFNFVRIIILYVTNTTFLLLFGVLLQIWYLW